MSFSPTKSQVHVNGAARTHMDVMECTKYADSKEGVVPLVAPNLIKKHLKDPNEGLYPRQLHSQPTPSCSKSGNNFPSFSRASELRFFKKPRYDKNTEWEQGEISYPSASFHINHNSRRKLKKNNSAQQNKIHNYFLSSQNDSKDHQIRTSNKNSSNEKNKHTSSSSTFSSKDNVLDITRVEASLPEDSPRDSCFGLFGASEFEDEELQGINYFELLPPAVLEQILCQIPYLDLMKLKLVCNYWNEVISNEKFMQWKKTYYRLKSEDSESQKMLQALCMSMDLKSVNDCFICLIRYMDAGYARKPSHSILDTLKKHPKYVDIHSMLIERFQDWACKEPSPWCIIAGIVILSETVWDIYSIFHYLLNSTSRCSVCDILECMYCIATFLLYFKNIYKINRGLHYRIYYALYLYENNYSGTSDSLQTVQRNNPGQQSIHKYRLATAVKFTHEQMRIMNHDLRKDQVVKIVAFAGTGKTSTLIEFTRLHPNMKFLNIMFNKAVCEHAAKCFPSNVACRTAHSLANEKIGRQYRHKICFKIRAHDLIPYVKMPVFARTNIFSYARCVLKTLEAYIASADEMITTAHVPLYMRNSEDYIIGRQLDTDVKLAVAKSAEEIWDMMIDKGEPLPLITHDVYLKLHQLSHPKFKNCDCILVDEAQDCNGAMLDIILSQEVPIIIVGDPNQQIYGFRGATNALENVKSTHTYYLTQSFRFGPEIAYIASCCIEVLKNCNKETLVGSSKETSVFGMTSGQYAIISRTNSSLFNEAVRLCCHKLMRENEPLTVRGAFAGGLSSYGFDQLLDIYNLMSMSETNSDDGSKELNLQIKNKFLQRFKTFKDLHSYAKRADEKELLGKISIVLQYNTKIPEYIAVIKQRCSNSLELANTIFSTAHKSKGLEFDTVCLTEDFSVGKIPFEDPQTRNPSMQEEFNILYVALTRAKKCLLLPDSLYFLLLTAQEKFEYPVSASKLLQRASSLCCVICKENFIPQKSLVLVRQKLVMASGRCIDGGPLCMKCATKPVIRPEIHTYPVIMQLDAVEDVAHRSMKCIVGPLPSETPLHDEEAILMELHDDDRIIILDLL